MKGDKKPQKVKDPVRVRQRKLANGMTGIVMANVDTDFYKGFIGYLRHARNGKTKEYSTITKALCRDSSAIRLPV